mmetsp:Transcript_9006/g.13053  ORF Transcript_9006/g.13053 Transcript_9006/m.13053 type:complete len:222 (-) Transcript_9006:3199-3864(-)
MSDKDKDKNTNKKGETSKPWTRGGKGKQYAPQVRKQPGEIPMLKFGTGNNFHVFKEAISKGGVKDFGHLGTLFETGKLYIPMMPTKADYTFLPDPDDRKLLYTEAVKSYMKQVNDAKMNSPKLFGYIWQYLSPESIDEVKHQAEYIKFNKDKDPVKLWETIVKTHEIMRVESLRLSNGRLEESIRVAGKAGTNRSLPTGNVLMLRPKHTLIKAIHLLMKKI